MVGLRLYQGFLSPLLPSTCRFYPSCSEYMHLAIRRHGAVKGISAGIKRLIRCHPWHDGWFDPPP